MSVRAPLAGVSPHTSRISPKLWAVEFFIKDEDKSSQTLDHLFLSIRTRQNGEELGSETFVSLIHLGMLKLHSTLAIYLRCITSSYRMSSIVSDSACCPHPSPKFFLHCNPLIIPGLALPSNIYTFRGSFGVASGFGSGGGGGFSTTSSKMPPSGVTPCPTARSILHALRNSSRIATMPR